MDNVLSPSMITVVLVFIIFGLFVWYMGYKIRRYDPLNTTSTFQVLVEMIFDFFGNTVQGVLGEKYRDKFTPLAMTMWITIFLSNIAGLFLLKESAIDLNYTFGMTLFAFVVWNGYAIKVVGIKGFMGQFGDPFKIMAPLDVIGFLAKPVSLMMRIFGNILSGVIVMGMIVGLPATIMEMSTALGLVSMPFFIVLVGTLSFYFSLFGPFIQSMVFTYLTLVNLSLLINEEE